MNDGPDVVYLCFDLGTAAAAAAVRCHGRHGLAGAVQVSVVPAASVLGIHSC